MADKIAVMYSEEEITARVKELAAQISRDYEGKTLYMVIILKGSIFFGSDLARAITVPVKLDFMQVSSYGDGTVSSGKINILKDLDENIAGKDVLVVEDIVDTGTTLANLTEELKRRRPASLKLCTLLDKPERRVIPVEVNYIGYQIPDEFVVGYGLDYAQNYRTLPYVGQLSLSDS